MAVNEAFAQDKSYNPDHSVNRLYTLLALLQKKHCTLSRCIMYSSCQPLDGTSALISYLPLYCCVYSQFTID